MLHPGVVFARNDLAAIGQKNHEEQDRDCGPERELHHSICQKSGHRLVLTDASLLSRMSHSRIGVNATAEERAKVILFPLEITQSDTSCRAAAPPIWCFAASGKRSGATPYWCGTERPPRSAIMSLP